MLIFKFVKGVLKNGLQESYTQKTLKTDVKSLKFANEFAYKCNFFYSITSLNLKSAQISAFFHANIYCFEENLF